MSEKTRSISISGSGGVMAPGIGTNIVSIPMSSSPSSVIGGSSGGSGDYMISSSNRTGGNAAIVAAGNDSESEIGINDLNSGIATGDSGGAGDSNSIMNLSQISTTSNNSVSIAKVNKNFTHNIIGNSCRFPKLEECAHFHYERVQLGSLSVRLVDDKSDLLSSSVASQSICGDIASFSTINATSSATVTIGQQNLSSTSRAFYPQICWFIIKVIPCRSDSFLIKRSFDNLRMLDEMLHRCVYDRKISGLKDLSEQDFKSEEDVEYAVAKYLERFSKIASDSITCGTILTWLQLDNKGRRLPLADTETMRSINTPAVGAAYGVRRYVAQACDEISIEVGDMISVIDMPSPAESIWWRGKKSHLQKSHYEVGFFPQSCVATIGDKVPRHFPLPAPLVGQLDVSPTKPVLRKHGKLIAFFRSFILSRPSRRRLKQTGIYRERVFSCDLSEHLLNSGQEIPMVLKCCAEFIEDNGIVDGIYRLSGITSNIQKLRRAFDEERIPDLGHPEIKQDIHAVSSLLKMYFRELPNPLCTYQLYDNFVEAIQAKSDPNERLRLMKETVLKLPPPHYRTLKYLATHLNKISKHSANTGMTDKNLAIVWAPNLLRSPALESGGVAALRGVGVQAVVTEYLIKNCNLIFDSNDDYRSGGGGYDQRLDSLTDCESLLIEQREHDASLSLIERPKSLSAGGAKLISLEEAQERHSRAESFDVNKSIPINAPPPNVGSYIEVGGGPSSLPDKYHTVLPVPRSWQKRKTHSWKSLFTRNPRNSNSNHDVKGLNVSSPIQKDVESNIPHSGSETNVVVINKSHNSISSIQSQQKPKSIDLFDGGKPMEICVRSNSIDSLRTAGHSRSVSHDSYFDLLQSPLRGVATCPSRELSELGLNFDREEPEMRIFSESESLVSSPKVGKENIPPSRRVLRARPEEFSSTTNSVNPSPKKQPRLNLLSPNETANNTWNTVLEENRHHDETCCKRYKLEDQLSDIQFIDCGTPEHTIQNPTTVVYASVQVHNPPSSASLSKSSSFNDDGEKTKKNTPTATFESIFENNTDADSFHARYSYPIIQLTGKRKENDAALKERFSYPGSGNNGGKYVCRMPASNIKMNIEEEEKKNEPIEHHRKNFAQKSDTTKMKNRYSYCDPTSVSGDVTPTISFSILRSNSADLSSSNCSKYQNQQQQQQQQQQDIGRSKLSIITPSSPIQSPNYSLLVGETSSENSSAINTPIFEMDITSHSDIVKVNNNNNTNRGDTDDEYGAGIAVTAADSSTPSTMDFNSGGSRRDVVMIIKNYDAKDLNNYIEDNNCSNVTSQLSPHNNARTDKRDITALKRELSLDLEGSVGGIGGTGTKMPIDLTNVSLSSINNKNHSHNNTLSQQQIINIIPLLSPNNSNFTQNTTNTSDLDTTSQSITPSEFCYHHLNRQSSNAVSLDNSPLNFIDTTNTSGGVGCYENFHDTFVNYENNSSSNNGSNNKVVVVKSLSPASLSLNTTTTTTMTGCNDTDNNTNTIVTPTTTTIQPQQQSSLIAKQNLTQTVTSTPTPTKASSPIKATISITYNLKSPAQKDKRSSVSSGSGGDTENRDNEYETISVMDTLAEKSVIKPLLETNFDENMVYEQVKFFRTSVSEVNKLLNNGNDDHDEQYSNDGGNNRNIKNEQQIVPKFEKITSSSCNEEVNSNLITLNDGDDHVVTTSTKHHHSNDSNDDILMTEDNLEIEQNLSLYENVELRKPPTHYENIEITAPKGITSTSTKSSNLLDKHKSLDNDYHKSATTTTTTTTTGMQQQQTKRSEKDQQNKSPSNFSVKQLATKFETSPIEQMAPFDFGSCNTRSSKKFTITSGISSGEESLIPTANTAATSNTVVLNRDSPCYTRAKNHSNKHLHRSHTQQITRSLDENAFVREFGHNNKRFEDIIAMNTKSVQQIEKLDDVRRKSFDFMRPKILNPPKKLPSNVQDCSSVSAHEPLCKTVIGIGNEKPQSKLKLDLQNVNENTNQSSKTDIKITPTTENRISLIQNNVIDTKSIDDDRSNSPNLSSSSTSSASSAANATSSNVKVLSGVKLNRERIEQIKEERRHQLSEKYRTESFKSKSKTELRELPKEERYQSESLRIKSKSRGDIRNLQQSRDIDKGSEIMQFSNNTRIRRISDEKNQNINCDTQIQSFPVTTISTSSTITNVPISVQKFERKSIDFPISRERDANDTKSVNNTITSTRNSISSTREKISPQFSIRDVTAMFESRSQNQ